MPLETREQAHAVWALGGTLHGHWGLVLHQASCLVQCVVNDVAVNIAGSAMPRLMHCSTRGFGRRRSTVQAVAFRSLDPLSSSRNVSLLFVVSHRPSFEPTC
jgi:hypothetical protein